MTPKQEIDFRYAIQALQHAIGSGTNRPSGIGLDPLAAALNKFAPPAGGVRSVAFTARLLKKASDRPESLDETERTELASVVKAICGQYSVELRYRTPHVSSTTGANGIPGPPGERRHPRDLDAQIRSGIDTTYQTMLPIHFQADSLDRLTEILLGSWRLYYVRATEDESGHVNRSLQANVCFLHKLSDRHCGLRLIGLSRIWEGSCFVNEYHLYFVWREMSGSEYSFMVTNKPSMRSPSISGIIMTLDRPDDTGRSIRPLSATFCFGHKCDLSKLLPLRSVDEGALRQITRRLLDGEPVDDLDANLIRDAYHTIYRKPEELTALDPRVQRHLKQLIVGDKRLGDLTEIYNLSPFRVVWP